MTVDNRHGDTEEGNRQCVRRATRPSEAKKCFSQFIRFQNPRPRRSIPGEQTSSTALRIDPGKIWHFVNRHRRTIAATTVASFVAMLLFVVLVKHQYTAVTQLLIDPSDLRVVENGLTPSNQMPDAVVLQVESRSGC